MRAAQDRAGSTLRYVRPKAEARHDERIMFHVPEAVIEGQSYLVAELRKD